MRLYNYRRSPKNHAFTETHPSPNPVNSTTTMFNLLVLLATIVSASLTASANQKELDKIHAILEKLFVSSTDYPKFCENAAAEKDIKDVRKF